MKISIQYIVENLKGVLLKYILFMTVVILASCNKEVKKETTTTDVESLPDL